MNDVNIRSASGRAIRSASRSPMGSAGASTGIVPCRSPALENALRELARMPVTEACLSGLCDICCLCRTDLCLTAGRQESQPSKSTAQ